MKKTFCEGSLKLKSIIVYGTRYGATKGTAEEIAKVLREENFDVKIVNVQEEKVKDISSVEPISVKEGKTAEVAKMHKIDLEDRESKYGLKPVSVGFFGGIVNFNRMGFLTRKGMEAAFKAPLQKHGFKETAPGAYDLRDWAEIRKWTKELAKNARE